MSIRPQIAHARVVLLAVSLGCTAAHREPEPTAKAGPVAAPAPAPVVAAAPVVVPAPLVAPASVVAPTPTPAATIVAGERGLFEIDLRGTVLRSLSTTPSRSPRWLPGRTQLVFLGKHGRSFTDLRRFDLADGSERSIAALPDGPPCLLEAYAAAELEPPELSLTNESELWITTKGEHACIVLADHEADLRDTDRTISVRLSNGDLDESVFGGTEVCGRDDEKRPPECEERPVPETGELASPFGDDGELAVESRSPDERWLLVLVRSELHDILHNEYVLYDVETKRSYPLPRTGNAKWPKPIDVAKLSAKHAGKWIDALDDVSGAEAVTWIGPHHLVVGRTLFVAGEAIVDLPGDVAL